MSGLYRLVERVEYRLVVLGYQNDGRVIRHPAGCTSWSVGGSAAKSPTSRRPASETFDLYPLG